MLAVPVSAAWRPAPDPVEAVCTDTAGHSLWICWTHRLNSGKRRLEPDSWSDTVDVGQFSRLERDVDASVVTVPEVWVLAGVEGDELQAAASSATPAPITRMRARGRRRRPWPAGRAATGSVVMSEDGRVG